MTALDLHGDGKLLKLLNAQSAQLQKLVPDVVGMSVCFGHHGLTFTWQHPATDTAEVVVRTSVSMPVFFHDTLSTIVLYASSADAFDGLTQDIAVVFGAWAPGAVFDTDLRFSTRSAAEDSPERLRIVMRIELAVGILAGSLQTDLETAREVLRLDAQRKGIAEIAHAESIIQARNLRGN